MEDSKARLNPNGETESVAEDAAHAGANGSVLNSSLFTEGPERASILSSDSEVTISEMFPTVVPRPTRQDSNCEFSWSMYLE